MLEFNLQKVQHFIATWYPHIYNKVAQLEKLSNIYECLRAEHVCGIRPLITLTGIKHLVVNNSYAKKLIEEEIANEFPDVIIDVLYHPIEDLTHIQPINIKPADNTYMIGSFGMANNEKQIDLIIETINVLNNDGFSIKLLLAGYNMKPYLSSLNISQEHLIIKDSPPDEELLSLMKSVDCAVQLRKNPHGESSGCISQLLGMNQKIITSEGFISDEYKPYCHIVPKEVSVSELKEVIKTALLSKGQKNDLSSKYTYASLAQRLYQIAAKEK